MASIYKIFAFNIQSNINLQFREQKCKGVKLEDLKITKNTFVTLFEPGIPEFFPNVSTIKVGVGLCLQARAKRFVFFF